MTVILVDDLTFGYTSKPIFRNLSLELRLGNLNTGRIITVMGGSGCGKTTFLRLIAGLERPRSGTISVEPSDMMMSYFTQEPVIFDHLSRTQNAEYFRRVKAVKGRFDTQLFHRLLGKLRLEDTIAYDASPSLMSGGERQRLVLLRALSLRPKILLLDEPCTGLDLPVKQEFLTMLREITDEYGLLVLYVTHHAEEARLIADQIVYMFWDRQHGYVVVTHRDLPGFIKALPTIDAARLFSGSASNVLDCLIEDGILKYKPTGTPIGRYLGGVPESYAYKVVFPPETVHWKDSGGLEVTCVARSSKFCFARLLGNGRDVRLIGPPCEFEFTHAVLEGVAYLFDSDGKQFGQITIEGSGQAGC
jgi:ABC-type multidrug transport system ATPase subunit